MESKEFGEFSSSLRLILGLHSPTPTHIKYIIIGLGHRTVNESQTGPEPHGSMFCLIQGAISHILIPSYRLSSGPLLLTLKVLRGMVPLDSFFTISLFLGG